MISQIALMATEGENWRQPGQNH